MARYNWLLIVLLFGLSTGAGMLQSASKTEAAPTEVIPDQYFTTVSGETISLYQFKGRMVLIHFWASWCPPCIKELPSLLQAAHDNPKAVVIAVSIDRNKEAMTRFLLHINNLSTVKNVYFVHDPNAQITVNGVEVNRYPETFIITRGMTIGAHIKGGLEWSHFDFDQ